VYPAVSSHLQPKLTEVADEAGDVDEELGVGDEEAVDSGHVGDVLHERLGVVGAEQAVGGGDRTRQSHRGFGVRRGRRVPFRLIHCFLLFLLLIFLIVVDVLPLFWKIVIETKRDILTDKRHNMTFCTFNLKLMEYLF